MTWKLHEGDAIEVMSLLPAESVDLIICDPPYGIAYQSGHRPKMDREVMAGDYGNLLWRLLPAARRVLKKDGAIYLFTRFDVSPEWWLMLGNYFRPKNKLIWVKNNWGMGDLQGNWASQYEEILFAVKGRHKLQNGRPSNVLHVDRIASSKMVHPTEKPVEIMMALIEASCPVGGVVLDPCAGSGPVVEACERLERDVIAVEINPDFCDAIERRMARYAAHGTQGLLLAAGGAE
jgi:site-specific DNA-methyltransferase (adenine-specific)